MMVHETTELWCEPGRALVAEGSSLLTRVELRKGDALYLNDGSYGALFDAAHAKWPFPVKLVRDGDAERRAAEAVPLLRPDLRLPRPMPGPFWLPEDVRRGRLRRDRHAGGLWRRHGDPLQRLRRPRAASVEDAPMASMYGLAPRSIPTPRGETATVVKLSRAVARSGGASRPAPRRAGPGVTRRPEDPRPNAPQGGP